MFNASKLLTMTALLLASNVLFASNHSIAIGRYLSTSNQPSHEQQDLLSTIFQVHFTHDIQTVGDAMDYLLRYSGYSLVEEARQTTALKNTLKKPLPLIDRNFGPMRLKDALITLVGPAFILINDPLNREVNFKLKTNVSRQKG